MRRMPGVRRVHGLLVLGGSLLLPLACRTPAEQAPDGATVKATPTADAIVPPADIDAELGEVRHPREIEMANKIAAAIEAQIRRDYKPGEARRDAHPKAHGCVRAEFAVNPVLEPRLAQGVFVPGKSYKAIIRFSNGDGDPKRPDIKGDARGMAIKLLDVPGPKLLEVDAAATTQDFIMINHPVFFMDDPEDYLRLIEKIGSTNPLVKLSAPLTLGFRGTLIARAITSKKLANPLQARYWSMVPYRLGGDQQKSAVKFSAKPCNSANDPLPTSPGPDYLREAMQRTLSTKAGCFEFLVQPRTTTSQSVEDSMTEWPENVAPFVKVAHITISPQTFDTPDQMRACENLSYNPWHALAEHRPLGAINRMRKVIYNHVSRVRHAMNGVDRTEPEVGDK